MACSTQHFIRQASWVIQHNFRLWIYYIAFPQNFRMHLYPRDTTSTKSQSWRRVYPTIHPIPPALSAFAVNLKVVICPVDMPWRFWQVRGFVLCSVSVAIIATVNSTYANANAKASADNPECQSDKVKTTRVKVSLLVNLGLTLLKKVISQWVFVWSMNVMNGPGNPLLGEGPWMAGIGDVCGGGGGDYNWKWWSGRYFICNTLKCTDTYVLTYSLCYSSATWGMLLRGRPLEIPGGGGGGLTIPKKNSCKGSFSKKKIRASSTPSKINSCKQGKVINPN